MTDIILCGACGRMGRVITALAAESDSIRIAAGVDPVAAKGGISAACSDYPLYADISEVTETADVIVGFSHHSGIGDILTYAVARSLPVVVCATGHTDDELAAIAAASEKIAVFKSGNMSLGINLLCELVRRAARALGEDFDIEILERHHNKKLDAPSGTALMLADAAREGRDSDCDYVYERRSRRAPREKSEIGISAMRGGNIVGMHDVMFAGQDETLTLSHTAQSRDVFARGALRAASFMHGKPAGRYDMSDVIKGDAGDALLS